MHKTDSVNIQASRPLIQYLLPSYEDKLFLCLFMLSKCYNTITTIHRNNLFSLTVQAQASSCLDAKFAPKLSYQWQVTPSAGFTLPNTNYPR